MGFLSEVLVYCGAVRRTLTPCACEVSQRGLLDEPKSTSRGHQRAGFGTKTELLGIEVAILKISVARVAIYAFRTDGRSF